MYEEFYGLNQKPFALTPNPRFLFYSEQYREAEDQLLYGLNNREGFMVLTGLPGTGKTTLCRDLLDKMDSGRFHSALIFNPFMNGLEMLASLLTEFGISVPENASRKEMLDRLNRFLLAQLVAGKHCVAIFDEAQHLAPEFLEQIRVLSNLETDNEKLLQIVLVGQPELNDRLRTSSMVQLDQRVSVRCVLTNLSERETDRYIHHRLDVAGARGQVRFGQRAVPAIYQASGGVPRLINMICDRALLAGFADQSREITVRHVNRAVSALRGEELEIRNKDVPRPFWKRGATIGAFAALTLTVAGAGGYAALHRATPVPETAEALYWRAATASSPADAAQLYDSVVVRFPGAKRAVDAAIKLAQIALAQGDRAGALHQLDRLAIDTTPITRTRVGLVRATILLDAGDSVAGCGALESARQASAGVDSSLRAQVAVFGRGCDSVAPVSPSAVSQAGVVDSAASRLALTADTSRSSAPRQTEVYSQPVPRAAGAESAPAASAIQAGGFTVQLAVAADAASAEVLRSSFVARGVKVEVVELGGRYVVRAGRYRTRSDAEEQARVLTQKGITGFVTPTGTP